MFEGKRILITGGTGSFGHAVLKHFLNRHMDTKEIRIFSRDEKKQDDMRKTLSQDNVKFYVGDVRDYQSVYDALHQVDYVFHAAALKQVPSCEFYPMEAVKTNILGSENVFNACIAQGVEKVILLSTDKAVYPINAMGMSKAMAEKIMVAKSSSIATDVTTLSATRYGNVMGSRGSVIPLFIEQIKKNMDITVTDPKMTRFLMSIEEAVELVIHAFQHAQSGDIFVQKAPAATIENIATALIDIFNSSSKIKIIGTRHGEKLYESLVSREELTRARENDRYYRIAADSRDLNYNKYFSEGDLDIAGIDDYTSNNTKQLTLEEVKHLLLELDDVKEALQ